MFHAKEGLFFERIVKGSVRVIKTYDGRAPRADNVVVDLDIAENEWASIVASVSKLGEDHDRWMQARRFHGLEEAPT